MTVFPIRIYVDYQIVAHLCGGLANQMFQYALGRTLSLRLQVPLRLNISTFSNSPEAAAHVAWRLPLFPHAVADDISVDTTPPPLLHKYLRRINLFALAKLNRDFLLFSSVVTEPYFEYWLGIEHISAPAHLYGYWQSEKYFISQAYQIRKDFAFPALSGGEALGLAVRIKACPNAVSVHIRRGDYISNPQARAFHGLPGPDYYRAALEHVRTVMGDTTVFLFSDDPQWVRENFDSCGHACEVVDLNLPDAPQHDMHLMSMCRHHVIANSSFSWWGAWLGAPGGITIAPKRWFADQSINTDDIYPPSWIRL